MTGASATALRLTLLCLATIPAMTGYPLSSIGGQWLPGMPSAWLAYWGAVYLMIWGLMGPRRLADTVTVAALIAAPVVFGGAAVSTLGYATGLGGPPASFGRHYVSLAISILTVVPLGLAIVAAIPFHHLELHLLTKTRRVTRFHKYLLIGMRVFNHIVHGVVPLLLEVVREEGTLMIDGDRPTGAARSSLAGSNAQRLRSMGRTMVQMGVAAICLSVQYIPLWAMEIAALPDRRPPHRGQPPPPAPPSASHGH
jgi:hypothetical protein